jgi:hypothetical protein
MLISSLPPKLVLVASVKDTKGQLSSCSSSWALLALGVFILGTIGLLLASSACCLASLGFVLVLCLPALSTEFSTAALAAQTKDRAVASVAFHH